jgi:transcriptional regulator with GAF, ATPase, and Fis domain
MSLRASKEFIPINCGGLHETTLTADLFGYKKGAFTGAKEDTEGALKRADGGTLFLDEVGDIPMKAQTALLRFLNDGTYERLGEIGKLSGSNVRIICATNKDLSYEIREGRFREDLYYRISVFPICIPSLAPLNDERASKAFKTFLDDISKELNYNLTEPLFIEKAFKILVKYNYPGNYREMRNILEYAIVKSGGKTIHPEHLPDYITGSSFNRDINEYLSLPADQFLPAINKLIYNKFSQVKNEVGTDAGAGRAFGITIQRFQKLLEKSQRGKAIKSNFQ